MGADKSSQVAIADATTHFCPKQGDACQSLPTLLMGPAMALRSTAARNARQDIHDKGNTHTWYDSDGNSNGASAGVSIDGTYISGNCDTEKFVAPGNAAGLCAASDWRLSKRKELRRSLHEGVFNSAIAGGSFPSFSSFPNTQSNWLRLTDWLVATMSAHGLGWMAKMCWARGRPGRAQGA